MIRLSVFAAHSHFQWTRVLSNIMTDLEQWLTNRPGHSPAWQILRVVQIHTAFTLLSIFRLLLPIMFLCRTLMNAILLKIQ